MQDHRLGYPAVLAALQDHEPRRSFYTPSRGRRSAEEDSDRAELDGALTSDLQAPPSVSRYVEPAYRAEGFGFAYVDRKGHQSDVIPQREAAKVTLADVDDAHDAAGKRAGWDVVAQFTIDFLALAGLDAGSHLPNSLYAAFIEGLNGLMPKAEAQAAPQEWQTVAPPERGWWEVGKHVALAGFWDGSVWTHIDAITNNAPGVLPFRLDHQQWRGPRLSGPRWPEPEMSFDTLQSICDKWQSDNAHIDRKELCAISDAIARRYGAEAPCGIPAGNRAAFAAELQGLVLATRPDGATHRGTNNTDIYYRVRGIAIEQFDTSRSELGWVRCGNGTVRQLEGGWTVCRI